MPAKSGELETFSGECVWVSWFLQHWFKLSQCLTLSTCWQVLSSATVTQTCFVLDADVCQTKRNLCILTSPVSWQDDRDKHTLRSDHYRLIAEQVLLILKFLKFKTFFLLFFLLYTFWLSVSWAYFVLFKLFKCQNVQLIRDMMSQLIVFKI